MTDDEWERTVADAWAGIDEVDEATFLARIEQLGTSAPYAGGEGLFEQASSLDSTGHSDLAVPLYATALERGLTGERRRRANIQMASSLRNLGRPDEAVDILTAERLSGTDSLDDAVVGFLALALADVGREREALSLVLVRLAAHLPRYQRSMANYASDLTDSTAGEPAVTA